MNIPDLLARACAVVLLWLFACSLAAGAPPTVGKANTSVASSLGATKAPAQSTALAATALNTLPSGAKLSGTLTMVDHFNDRSTILPWTFWNGAEYPGASGTLTPGAGYASTRGAALNYNIDCMSKEAGGDCGLYVSASLQLPRPVVGTALTFMAKSTPDIQVVVRVVDQSGQTLQYRPGRPLEANDPNSWYRVVVTLNQPEFFWGGAGNGVVHGAIQAIAILAADPPEYPAVGVLAFDDVAVLSSLNAQYVLQPATSPLFAASPGSMDLGSRVGVAHHSTQDDLGLDLAHAAGISFVRTDLFWVHVEAGGQFDFWQYDQLVNALEARGMGTLFILAYDHPDYDRRTPQGIAAFARYAEAAARHYVGRNVRFEVWNEPNLYEFWGASTNAALEYAALCKAAIAAVRRGNPTAIVSTGGIGGFDLRYLRDVLSAGAAENADAIGVHPYRASAPETLVDDVLRVDRLIRNKLGRSVALWNTEWGYSGPWIQGDGHTAATRRRQGVLAAREILSNWALNLPMAVWYDLADDGPDGNNGEHNFGLLDVNYKEKPSMQALRAALAAAKGRTYKGLVKDAPAGMHVMKFEGPGDVVFVAWNSLPQASIAFRFPAYMGMSARNFLGAGVSGTTQIVGTGYVEYRVITLRETDGPIYVRYVKSL